MSSRRTRTKNLILAASALGFVVAAGWLAPSLKTAVGLCEDVCNHNKPCDKRCELDGYLSTCGEYGVCNDNPPPPPVGCADPAISANPENGIGDGSVNVALCVSNSSNDLLTYAFEWQFGNGATSQAGLCVSHAFATGSSSTTYTVAWSGWAQCSDGSHVFKVAYKNVTATRPGGSSTGSGSAGSEGTGTEAP